MTNVIYITFTVHVYIHARMTLEFLTCRTVVLWKHLEDHLMTNAYVFFFKLEFISRMDVLYVDWTRYLAVQGDCIQN